MKKQTVDNKDIILKTAKKLFAKNGYEATTTRKISDESNTSDGLLYYYFKGGKKQILEEIIAKDFREIVSLINVDEKLQYLSLEDCFEAIYLSFEKVFNEYNDALKIIVRDGERLDLSVKKLIKRIASNRNQGLNKILEYKIKIKEIKEVDVNITSDMLISLMLNSFFITLTGLGEGLLSYEQKRKQMIKFVLSLLNYNVKE